MRDLLCLRRKLARLCVTRSGLASENGAISPALVGMVLLIIFIGMIFMLKVGDAVADRRGASGAADAAALGAADYCADRLERVYKQALAEDDDEDFWAWFGKPVYSYCPDASAKASEYASKNSATLRALTPMSGYRYQASVDNDGKVADTGLRVGASATAKMVFVSGVCVKHGRLGVEDHSGVCLTRPKTLPKPTPSPTPSLKGLPVEPQATPSPESTRPKGLGYSARVDTKLVSE